MQQLVAIARALEDDTHVLVLDEPTASLDAAETARLLDIVRDLKARGLAIVFISHFLEQVYAIADRLTVLRNGRRVGVGTPAELPRAKLVPLMLGRELEAVEHIRPPPLPAQAGEPILVVEGLGKARTMAPFDLDVAPWRSCRPQRSPGRRPHGKRQADFRRARRRCRRGQDERRNARESLAAARRWPRGSRSAPKTARRKAYVQN